MWDGRLPMTEGLGNEQKNKEKCPVCGQPIELKQLPVGWGHVPKKTCSNPDCPGKKKKSPGWGN